MQRLIENWLKIFDNKMYKNSPRVKTKQTEINIEKKRETFSTHTKTIPTHNTTDSEHCSQILYNLTAVHLN